MFAYLVAASMLAVPNVTWDISVKNLETMKTSSYSFDTKKKINRFVVPHQSIDCYVTAFDVSEYNYIPMQSVYVGCNIDNKYHINMMGRMCHFNKYESEDKAILKYAFTNGQTQILYGMIPNQRFRIDVKCRQPYSFRK